MIKKIVVVLMLLPIGAAADTFLNLGGTSYHIDTSYSYNEINPGLAIEIEVPGDRRFIAGVYRNSQSAPGDAKTSKIVAMEQIIYRLSPHVGFGVVAGAVDGYRYADGGFAPLAALSARLDADHYGMRIMYTPPIKNVTPAVISLQIIVAIGD